MLRMTGCGWTEPNSYVFFVIPAEAGIYPETVDSDFRENDRITMPTNNYVN